MDAHEPTQAPPAGDRFYDRSHRYSWLLALEVAGRIAADPTLLRAGQQHLDTFARPDPHQRAAYALWSNLIAQGPDAVIARLTERSERGDYARETAPVFCVIPPARRWTLVRRARAGKV